MHQLVYVSAAAQPMTEPELNGILEASRRNNARDGVTGMLLHIDGGFLQVLEGPREIVQHTFGRILLDTRHRGISILVEQNAVGRVFGRWNMGFLEPSETLAPDVFVISKQALAHAVPPEKAQHIATLIRTFYRINTADRAA